MDKGRWLAWTVLAVATALAGCGGEPPAPERPRPVLVAQPRVGAGAGVEAFAGDVRARAESPLAFRVAGNLTRRLVDVGDRVRAGQLLATLDPGDQRLQAEAARADLGAAEAELVRARGDQARYAVLAADQLVSRSTLDAQDAALRAAEGRARAARAQAAVAGNQAGYTELRAPRDGVIASRQAEAGQVVAAGQAVYTLAADGAREVVIALPEQRYRAHAVGEPARVELWSLPGQRLQGRIREIAPSADTQARTYAARIELDAASSALAELGQSARVYLASGSGDATLRTVPLSSLQRGADGKASVWVVDPRTGILRAMPVQPGAYTADTVPVRGVPDDAWVVVAGGHLLREGQVVTPVDRDNRPVTAPAAPTAPAAAAAAGS